MRLLPAFALLALAGCGTPSASFCGTAQAHDVVDSVHGTDVAIEDGTLILHTAASKLELRDANGCHALAVEDIVPGDRVAHDADEIAESYPAQAWPDHVVVVRG